MNQLNLHIEIPTGLHAVVASLRVSDASPGAGAHGAARISEPILE